MMDTSWQRLPWQATFWQHWCSQRGAHHAWLLRGPAGIGKGRLARAMVAAWLCEQPGPDGSACGTCGSCGWLAAGNHPDFRLVQPAAVAQEESLAAAEAGGEGPDDEGAAGRGSKATTGKAASQQITIDQVRSLDQFFNLTTHRAGARVLLIEPAEAMNAAAANALLKTLEEPPPGTRFLLVSHEPRRLPATVRSRCLPAAFGVPPEADALVWLEQALTDAGMTGRGAGQSGAARALLRQAAGRPLAALAMADPERAQARQQFLAQLQSATLNPHALAEKASRETVAAWTEWLQAWVHDLVRVQAGGQPRFHDNEASVLATLAQRANPGRLLDLELRLREARWESRQPVNARLFCDALLLDYRALFP